MLLHDTRLTLGALDLLRYLGCATATWRDWQALGAPVAPITWQASAPEALTTPADVIAAHILGVRQPPYEAYIQLGQQRLEAFLTRAERPEARACAACATCDWAASCAAQWRAEDSLYSLRGISRPQIATLEASGITTTAQLIDRQGPIPDLPQTSRDRLTQQAEALRDSHRAGPQLRVQSAPSLPRPEQTDIFLTLTDGYEALIADIPHQWPQDQAAAMIGQLMDHPQARLYHFGAATKTALRQDVTRLGLGESWLDDLLRTGRLIDLAPLCRNSLISSEALTPEGLAPFYDGAPVGAAQISALAHLLASHSAAAPEAPETPERTPDTRPAELASMIAAADLPPARAQMLFDLGLYHAREAKPAQWAVFDSQDKEFEALIQDLDALAGLQADGDIYPIKRSVGRDYRFARQESKLRAGKRATIATETGPQSVTIEAMDRAARRLTLKVGPGKGHLLRDTLHLHPDWPIRTDGLEAAVESVIADLCGPKSFRALDDLLSAHPPRLQGVSLTDLDPDDPLASLLVASQAMDHSLLPVQGPPGTGKTFVTARAILALVAKGHRVAVASNSHEAIRNLLQGCAEAEGPRCEILHKVGHSEGPPAHPRITETSRNDDPALMRAPIVGGTAFLLSRPEFEQAFDWLFVDEAGQISLANLLAMGKCARNIVLVGDPRQLPQVVQASHPDPAGLSCLDWLLQGAAILPPDRGLFLRTSRRMHPAICDYISDQVYEGALKAHPDTAQQAVIGTPWPEAGAFWVDCPHQARAQIAPEEVTAIAQTIPQLLGGTWRDKAGQTRPLTAQDIIVVAPYNAQVNALSEALPTGVRVGTVDRFQGQEAPICLISMTASSTEDSARGMEFLLSLNRINVAVSRAQGLALVFGSPALRHAPCATLSEMRLINAICALPKQPVVY